MQCNHGFDARHGVSAVLAVPLLEVCERLQMPAVLTHSCLVLSNYRLIDPNGPFDTSNLATLVVREHLLFEC